MRQKKNNITRERERERERESQRVRDIDRERERENWFPWMFKFRKKLKKSWTRL